MGALEVTATFRLFISVIKVFGLINTNTTKGFRLVHDDDMWIALQRLVQESQKSCLRNKYSSKVLTD